MKIETQLILCVMVEFARTQFTSNRRLAKSPCEIRGTALVEQFFNVIFAEFQHSPPICTCVQMCADQPTYCYPNGCFKKVEKRKEASPVSSIQQDMKTVFLVDDDRDVITDLMDANIMASSVAENTVKSYQRPWESNTMGRTNPFKDIVFKYKRLPKLQMKYNLREQLKHTRDKKAEIDLSKTRWPTNKQINRQTNYHKSSNYLTSVYPEFNQSETSKYFKRYLTKRENQIGLDISALYLYKDASNFSLETLIDNLIERSLEGNSTLKFKINNSSKLKEEENNGDILMNYVVDDLQNDTNKIAVKVTLIANDTENNNNNQYKNKSDHTNTSTAVYFEMITTLSKEIEKQNNASMTAMEHLTGNTYNDISDTKTDNILNSIRVSKATDNYKTALNLSEEAIKYTTNKIPTTLHFIPVINSRVGKSKQRIVRKLRNRKLN